ncbi:LLM class flavin-dependent oxidoreductase [Microbacterium hydrocarbonoxydans]|uniref:LLM class flavin-dependent oxidoreductase n=1 Tax=Microbacterium hydrocarbonoxydans TaxID=273678 RepID=UPI00203F7785|nr:LLM class flavin-dependent oxidoreductase [Microbacterium hydrocarbonoxydans]MCM3781128.1 LLM class flavin-dependent oxidoreductase [Microbacterium hydrocarbonoxydans]
MSEPKRLILNLFEMNCVSHITHGLWRLPGNRRTQFTDIEYWTELAQLLEAGGFDAVFLADVIGAYDVFRGGPETAIREGLQIPSNDPMLVVPAMAAVTQHLGFGITFSTTYEPPFAFARRMSTLDHLTKGRVGWNIVTSYLPNAARNFGLDGEVDHDTRYEIADEYLEVLYKLWEGSWDDDAIVEDRENGVFADPEKIRYINHRGPRYSVAGPHLSSPSRQRTPFLIQATQSSRGIEFAGRHAELIFTGGRSFEQVSGTIAKISDELERQGRARDDIKFVVGATVIVAPTREEAEAKLAEYERYASIDGVLAHASLPFDPTAHPADLTLGEALRREGRADDLTAAFLPQEQTIGEFLATMKGFHRKPFMAVGSPTDVADEIESWLDEHDIDGINLVQYHSYDTARDFIDYAVPELRRRGRLRDAYTPGETLRERVHGAGPRVAETHPAARFRGGRGLDEQAILEGRASV